MQLFTSSSGLRFVFCLASSSSPPTTTTTKTSWSNEVNEMRRKGRELVEKVTHTHSPIVTTTGRKKKKKKKTRPSSFGNEGLALLARVCYVCACPIPRVYATERERAQIWIQEKKAELLFFFS
jgi:hypothetical protein